MRVGCSGAGIFLDLDTRALGVCSFLTKHYPEVSGVMSGVISKGVSSCLLELLGQPPEVLQDLESALWPRNYQKSVILPLWVS